MLRLFGCALRGLFSRSLFRRLSCQLRGLRGCLILRCDFLRCPQCGFLRGLLRGLYCRLLRSLLRIPLRLAFGGTLGFRRSLRLCRHRTRIQGGRVHWLKFTFSGFLHAQPGNFPDLCARIRKLSVLCAMQIRPGIKGSDVVRSSVLITLPFAIRHWTPFCLSAPPISDLG
jgi:hypothetical protein